MYANSLSVGINRILISYHQDVVEYLNIQSHRTAAVLPGLGISVPKSMGPRRQCPLPRWLQDQSSDQPEDTCIHILKLELNNPGRPAISMLKFLR